MRKHLLFLASCLLAAPLCADVPFNVLQSSQATQAVNFTNFPNLTSYYFTLADHTISTGYQGGQYIGGMSIWFPWQLTDPLSANNKVSNTNIVAYTGTNTAASFHNTANWATLDLNGFSSPVNCSTPTPTCYVPGTFNAAIQNGTTLYLTPGSSAVYPVFIAYDTSKPFSLASIQASSAPARGGQIGPWYGWNAGDTDGTYVYYCPVHDDASIGKPGNSRHGNVVRYDTRTPFNMYQTGSAWTYFDMEAAFGAQATNFQAALYDGHRYIYFVPGGNISVVRYDTQADFKTNSSYKLFNITNLGTGGGHPNVSGVGVVANLGNFAGGMMVYDNATNGSEYLYMVPWSNTGATQQLQSLVSTAVRVKVGTVTGGVWSYVDITGTDAGYTGPDPSWQMYDLSTLTTNSQYLAGCWPTTQTNAGIVSSALSGWQQAVLDTTSYPNPRVIFGASRAQFWAEHDVSHNLYDPSGWWLADASANVIPNTYGGAYVPATQTFYPAEPVAPGHGSMLQVNFWVDTSSPIISNISPSFLPVTRANQTLTVNGSFNSGSQVYWNCNPLTTTFVSSSKLTATVPASYLSVGGTASMGNVSVINANGSPSGLAQVPVLPPAKIWIHGRTTIKSKVTFK